MSFGKYSKFIVALIGALVVFVQQMGYDNDIITTLITLATAVGVYSTPNKEM